jgi:hypothetical protein
MPQRLYPPEAPQSIGEVLDSVFRIFRASLVKCLPFGIAAVVVSQVPAMYALAAGLPRGTAPASPTWWALYALSTLASVVIWAALLLRVRALATGEPTSGRREFAQAIGRMPAILGGAVLALLVAGASLVPFAAVTALAGQAAALPLLVVALYVGIPLCFATPPIVLEGSGPLAGLRRGFHLVHRNWWRTFGVLVVALVLVIVFYAVGGLLAAMAMPFAGTADVAFVTAVSTVVVIVIGSLGAPFGCALVLAIYGDLTVRREGGDLRERLARLPAE